MLWRCPPPTPPGSAWSPPSWPIKDNEWAVARRYRSEASMAPRRPPRPERTRSGRRAHARHPTPPLHGTLPKAGGSVFNLRLATKTRRPNAEHFARSSAGLPRDLKLIRLVVQKGLPTPVVPDPHAYDTPRPFPRPGGVCVPEESSIQADIEARGFGAVGASETGPWASALHADRFRVGRI